MEQKPRQGRYIRAWLSSPDAWRELREVAREQRAHPTPAEQRLWRALRGRMLGARFRRQHAIGPFVVDFYCAERRLVIEVDGPVHERQVEQDAERQAHLEATGLKVLRFRNEEILSDTERVLQTIAANLTPNPSPTSERGA